MGNSLRTFLLLAALSVLVVLAGRSLAGPSGMVMASIFAALMNLGAWWFSDKIALMASHAQEVSPAEAPDLYRIVRNLVQRAGMPMPRLFIIPDGTPNAFATGRSPDRAVVAVTAGLVDLMSEDELEGVLAHELAHVRNRDTLFMAIAATLAAVITMLADMARWAMIFGGGHRDDEGENPLVTLALIIVAPLAAMLIQLAVSRSREFEADAAGARITGRPLSLANALMRLERANEIRPLAVASPAMAHMYIVNPLGPGSLISKMFSTHPPIGERVERLREMLSPIR